MQSIIRLVNKIIFQVIQTWKYIKLSFIIKPWDYVYCFEILKFQLSEMRQEILKGPHDDKEKTAKSIDVMI